MAKEYTEKAKRQLMPETKQIEDELKNMRTKVDEIFTATKKSRDEMSESLRLFEGELYDTDQPEFKGEAGSEIQYNTIFSSIQSVAPMVTDNRPITRVVPRKPWMEKIGIGLNDMAKYFWQACDMQMFSYRYVMDAMIFGHAVAKLGYDPNKRWGGEVTVDLIDPRDFFIAPGYETIWDAPFCGVRTKKPISWVRANFPDIEEIQGATDFSGDEGKKAYKFGDIDQMTSDTKFVQVYEVWSRDDYTYEYLTGDNDEGRTVNKERVKKYPYGKICYFTDQQWLDTKKATDEHNLPPYVELWDYIRPHDFTGMSEVTQIKGLHKELNLLLKYLSEYVRRYHKGNIFINESAGVDAQDIKDTYWEGGQGYTFDGFSGQEPITVVPEPPLNPEVFRLFTILPQIIEEVSGITDVTKGQVGKQERQSASEIAILLESSHTRTRQRVRNLEWSLKRIYYMLLRLTLQYYDEPRTISYNENGAQHYSTFTNDKAGALKTMEPSPLPEHLMGMKEGFVPMNPEDLQAMQQHQQEIQDYEKALAYFAKDGNTDPIYIDFDIEIQTDSMLPMDKQARANLYLRLLERKAIDPQAVLEFLQIPNASEIINRMMQQAQAMRGER